MIKDRIKICALVNIIFRGLDRYTSGVTLGEFSFREIIHFCTITPLPPGDIKYSSIE